MSESVFITGGLVIRGGRLSLLERTHRIGSSASQLEAGPVNNKMLD